MTSTDAARRAYVLAVDVAELSRALEILAARAYVDGNNAAVELGDRLLERVAKGKRVTREMGEPGPNPYHPATIASRELQADVAARLRSG